MFEKLKNHLIEMWKYFFTALEFDRQDKELSRSSGVPVPMPNGNLKNWFRIFGITLLIIVIIIFGLWNIVIGPKTKKQKVSHHGINKYGERY